MSATIPVSDLIDKRRMEVSSLREHFDRPLAQPDSHVSPTRLLLILIASVFSAEAIIMALLITLSPVPGPLAALLDSLALVLLVFPALYFFVLRPLETHIAQRKQAESVLAKSNQLLDRLFSITHILLAYMDPQFNFIQVNRAFAEAEGKTPDQLIGKNHFELFAHADDEEIFRRVVETGEPYFAYAKPLSYPLAPEGGESYWDWSLRPLKDSAGRVEGLILTLVDVTIRKKAEIALAESEALFRKVLETLPVGVWILDKDGCIVLANLASVKIWGGVHYVGVEDYGRYKAWRLDSGELMKAHEWAGARAVLNGETSLGEEIEIEAFDGTRKIILHSASPLITEGRGVVGAIVLNQDITERKKAEQEIQQRNRELAELNAAGTRLFAAEQKARRTAEVLREAGLALTQSLDMATVMEALLDSIGRLVPYDGASITLVEDNEHLSIHAARGCDCVEQLGRGDRLAFEREGNSPVELVIESRRGVIVEDVSSHPAWKLTPCNTSNRSWLGVPFVAGENVIGLCSLGMEQPGFYTAEHLQLAEVLASQAAVAVQNAWLFTQLRSSRERLKTLSRQLVEVQENERSYVARELHDEAGQVLTSLIVGLRLLERDAQHPEAVVAGIARLKGMVDSVLENLHRLAMDLRPASLDYLGLVAALRQHLEAIADQNEIMAQLDTVDMDIRLPKDLEVALYRIVQEALANVVRHARATRVDVLLERQAGRVIAVIEDNGIGFNEEAALNSGRLGLFGMRERAEMLGGSLTVECGRSGGTTLLVEVPYADSDPDRR